MLGSLSIKQLFTCEDKNECEMLKWHFDDQKDVERCLSLDSEKKNCYKVNMNDDKTAN